MTEVILWLVVLGIICFIFLILRFFQPELIYTLRQAIVEVEISKSFLEMDENKEGCDERFQKALAKDFRSESLRFDRTYVNERIQKVKELYNLQQVIDDDNRNFQNCIVELANLLNNVSQNLVMDRDNRYPLTFAQDVLEFLKDKRIEKDPNIKAIECDTIEKWFEANPISVEQSVEVLIAVINALLIREISSYKK